MSSVNTDPDDAQSGNDESRTIPAEYIEQHIYVVREQKIMLDSDLANLYQVTTGNLNLAVKRNRTRFPADFMFQLTKEEGASLLLQSAIAKKSRGGRQTSPYAFTELGVAMLTSVLNSEGAVQINILIMRAAPVSGDDACDRTGRPAALRRLLLGGILGNVCERSAQDGPQILA